MKTDNYILEENWDNIHVYKAAFNIRASAIKAGHTDKLLKYRKNTETLLDK